ncbi:hypothetical protein [Piscibacillus halophilus]|uniref:hypothetical protein n=1 Tax=Piscibacillus halophilus TaxID=571933 RepID=UPI000B864A43|nr:hypothetical protein [Piscibacillus halophilus]
MSRKVQDPIQLQQKLIHVQSELKKQQKRLNNYKQTYKYQMIEQLKQENAILESDNEELEEHLYSLEEKLDKYKSHLDVANIKVHMYQQALEKMNHEYSQLKDDYQDLKNDYKKLQDHLFHAQSSKQQIKEELVNKNKEVERYVQYKVQYEHRVEQLETQHNVLNKENDHYQNMNVMLKNQNRRLEENYKKFLIRYLVKQLLAIRGAKQIATQREPSSKERLIFELEKKLNDISNEIQELEN